MSGESGVAEYELGTECIRIRFVHSDDIYLYDNVRPGSSHVAEMTESALLGKGLTSYINRWVRKNYRRKERHDPDESTLD